MADLGAVGYLPGPLYIPYGQRVQYPVKYFPVPDTTISSTVTDDAGNPAARTVRCYRRLTGDLIDTVISDAVTGAYTVAAYSGEDHIIIGLDDDGGVVYNDKIKGRIIP